MTNALATRTWTPAAIDLICDLLGKGETFLEIGAKLQSSRSRVAGLVHRLKIAGDPRLPAERNKIRNDPAQRARATAKMDELAELLAEGLTVEEAAAAMGISDTLAYRYFARIRKQLGWQAR